MCVLIQEGDTALHKATRWGHTKTVEHLASAGADTNITNKVSQYVVFLYLVNLVIRVF